MKTATPKIVQSRGRSRYLWLALGILALAVATAVVGWGDHIQFREPPPDRVAPLKKQLARQAEQIVMLEAERRTLQEQLAVRERASQVDQEAIRQVKQALRESQMNHLEVVRELKLLRDIVSASTTSPGLYIQGFRVDKAEGAGTYRYRFTVSQALKSAGAAVGWIRLALEGKQDGESRMFDLTALTKEKEEKLKMRFRHFQDVDGLITLPEGFVPERVLVEVNPTNNKLPSLKKAFDWLVIN